ncbi:MAG: beta-N-acetylglucosaminidase domain-containing protein [Bacteroidales bacterium]|nr:beta-N-acetylglucosaminidase domain-containing protein [Bacteroidales bacterium]
MKRILLSLLISVLPIAAGAGTVYTIYPVPQQQKTDGSVSSFSPTVNIVAGPAIDEVTVQRAAEVLKSHGLGVTVSDKAVRGQSNLTIGVKGSRDAADRLAAKMRLCRELFSLPKYDRHILSLSADKSGASQVLILGEDTDASFCGLASLEQILDCGTSNLRSVEIHDWADVRDRGIIEGYYGVPYSAEVTMDIFRFMARYKMNTYMYGAKSDPYHSRFWSEPYPEKISEEQKNIGYLSQDMMKEITEVARATKVNFIWAIHPGVAFTDASYGDVNSRIMDKFESMYGLGVRQFGVFVDDVGVPYDNPSLKRCADRLTDLQNRIDRRWNVPGASPADTVKPLNYVPQLYAYSWTTRENARRFFQSLSGTPDKINIFITGAAVWTVPNNEDLDVVRDFLGRPTGWWWNYPCNDNDMTKIFPMDIYSNFRDERHIDNMARLEPLKDERTLIINPMQQGEISKITLFSVADYSWNNAAFNNDLSWSASLSAVVGKDRQAALRLLAPHLRHFDADGLKLDVTYYKESVREGHPRPAGLISKFHAIHDACQTLASLKDSAQESDRLFYNDIRPWLLRLDAMVTEAAALLRGESPAPVDYDNNPDFQFSVLNGMGESISLTTLTAEPSAEILQPLIVWLREQNQ